MTPADLDKLAGLLAAATPGEWYLLESPWLPRDCETSILAGSPDPHVAKFVCDFENFSDDDEKDKNGWNDAALIAAMKNALPELIAAARRLERLAFVLDEIEELLEGQQDVVDGSDGPRPNRAMSLLRELQEVRDAALSAQKGER